MVDEVTKNEIFSIVEKAVEDENFIDYKIDFRCSGIHVINGDCNLLAHCNIVGKNNYGHNLALDLLLKISEKSTKCSKIRETFRKEMFLFKNIFGAIHKFLKSKHVCFVEITPKYYNMFSTEDREVLVFNQLKELGYKLHYGELSATPQMKYCVLKNMAKFHAASFAFRDQNSEEFEDLINKWKPDIKGMFSDPLVEKKLKVGLKMAMDILIEENMIKLRNLLETYLENGVLPIIEQVLSNIPDDYVIVHGDCCMDNIMAKYEKSNTVDPRRIKLIFWQQATTHSPVLDLAYFLYFSHTEESNEKFEHYVEYYYIEFSKYLLSCGSDPQKLFPFTKLLDHLLKYSIFPLIMVLGGIPVIMVNSYLDDDKCVNENCVSCKNSESCGNCHNYDTRILKNNLGLILRKKFLVFLNYIINILRNKIILIFILLRFHENFWKNKDFTTHFKRLFKTETCWFRF